MANGPRVRQLLVTEDLRIPDNTWFVGAQRNTCNKAVTLYDDDLVPEHRRFSEVPQVWPLRSEGSWTLHNGSSVNFLGDGTIFWGDGTEELLRQDPVYQKQQENANRSISLRQQLFALRDTEILTAFPDTPVEKGLLSSSLVDELMRKRPKTRAEGCSKISQELRTKVDSKQVSH